MASQSDLYAKGSSIAKEVPFSKDICQKFVASSDLIFVCTFEKFSETKGRPLCAYFKLEKLLKGPPQHSNLIPVLFESTKHKGMDSNPKKNSRWIIFVKDLRPCDGMYTTFSGALGRVKYTKTNIALIDSEIKRLKNSDPD